MCLCGCSREKTTAQNNVTGFTSARTTSQSNTNRFLFEKPFMVEVDGQILNTGGDGYAAPCVFDFNGDGKKDLLVGYWAEEDGELLIYHNVGTSSQPRYDKAIPFETDGKIATVGSS
jgi:hypothetical protein